MTYWISLPYATFIIDDDNGIIVDAPPISKRSIGQKTEKVLEYYRNKGAKIICLGQ